METIPDVLGMTDSVASTHSAVLEQIDYVDGLRRLAGDRSYRCWFAPKCAATSALTGGARREG